MYSNSAEDVPQSLSVRFIRSHLVVMFIDQMILNGLVGMDTCATILVHTAYVHRTEH